MCHNKLISSSSSLVLWEEGCPKRTATSYWRWCLYIGCGLSGKYIRYPAANQLAAWDEIPRIPPDRRDDMGVEGACPTSPHVATSAIVIFCLIFNTWYGTIKNTPTYLQPLYFVRAHFIVHRYLQRIIWKFYYIYMKRIWLVSFIFDHYLLDFNLMDRFFQFIISNFDQLKQMQLLTVNQIQKKVILTECSCEATVLMVYKGSTILSMKSMLKFDVDGELIDIDCVTFIILHYRI